jgi:hypothetical protein
MNTTQTMEGDLMKRISIGIACLGLAALSVGCGKCSPQQESVAPTAATDYDGAAYDRTAQDQPTPRPRIDQGERAIELQAQRVDRNVHAVAAGAESAVERVQEKADDVSQAVDAVDRALDLRLPRR